MKKKLFDYYHRYKIIFQIKLEFLGATFEFAKKSLREKFICKLTFFMKFEFNLFMHIG